MSPSEPRRPRVALESTIITHGMPYPENAATARALEAEVRAAGAEPATIGVIGGTIRIGLTDAELEWLAQAKDVQKLSRADLPFAVARGLHGSTTVAATMICAHRAGIGVFATGGIGGVHRGAAESFDISASPRIGITKNADWPLRFFIAGNRFVSGKGNGNVKVHVEKHDFQGI